MTALPAIKPLRMPERIRQPGVSPLPVECRDSRYTFAGRDCCHCADYGDLRDAWLEHPADLEAFHELVEHVHECPVCVSRAASIPAVTSSVPRAWLVTEEG
jgi:hypothetical protein